MEQGSPLQVYTRQLTAKLNARYGTENLLIDYAMRYGKPSLSEKLQFLKNERVQKIIILPLYPQYSSTTTASVYDVLIKEMQDKLRIPSLYFISDYYQNPLYIQAIADSIQRHWQTYGQAELLLISFHGLPAKLTEQGDPYFYHCHRTAKLIADRLALHDYQWQLVFQSRFGKAKWLQPYCVDVLQSLPQQGVKNIDIICPGFAVDCLETLEEIEKTNKNLFIAAGGENYRYITALNDEDAHVELLNNLIKQPANS
jgi:ferrochelatase